MCSCYKFLDANYLGMADKSANKGAITTLGGGTAVGNPGKGIFSSHPGQGVVSDLGMTSRVGGTFGGNPTTVSVAGTHVGNPVKNVVSDWGDELDSVTVDDLGFAAAGTDVGNPKINPEIESKFSGGDVQIGGNPMAANKISINGNPVAGLRGIGGGGRVNITGMTAAASFAIGMNKPIKIKLVLLDGTPFKMISNLTSSATILDLMKYSGPDFDILTADGFPVSDLSTRIVEVASSGPSMNPVSGGNEYYLKLQAKSRTTAAILANEVPVQAPVQSNGTQGFVDFDMITHLQKLQVVSNCGLLFGRILGASPREAPYQLFRMVSNQIGESHFRTRKETSYLGKMARNGVVSQWADQGFIKIDIEAVAKAAPLFELTAGAGFDVMKNLANLDGSQTQTAIGKEVRQKAVIYINEGVVDYDAIFLRKLDAILKLSAEPSERQVTLLRQLERQYGSLVITEAAVGAELGIKGFFANATQQSEPLAMLEVMTCLKSGSLKSASTGILSSNGAETANKELYVRGGAPLVAANTHLARWMRTVGKHTNWVLVQVLKCRPWYFMLDAGRKQKVRALMNYAKGLNGLMDQLAKIGRLATIQSKKDEITQLLSFGRLGSGLSEYEKVFVDDYLFELSRDVRMTCFELGIYDSVAPDLLSKIVDIGYALSINDLKQFVGEWHGVIIALLMDKNSASVFKQSKDGVEVLSKLIASTNKNKSDWSSVLKKIDNIPKNMFASCYTLFADIANGRLLVEEKGKLSRDIGWLDDLIRVDENASAENGITTFKGPNGGTGPLETETDAPDEKGDLIDPFDPDVLCSEERDAVDNAEKGSKEWRRANRKLFRCLNKSPGGWGPLFPFSSSSAGSSGSSGSSGFIDKYPLDLPYFMKIKLFMLGVYDTVSSDLVSELVDIGYKLSIEDLKKVSAVWSYVIYFVLNNANAANAFKDAKNGNEAIAKTTTMLKFPSVAAFEKLPNLPKNMFASCCVTMTDVMNLRLLKEMKGEYGREIELLESNTIGGNGVNGGKVLTSNLRWNQDPAQTLPGTGGGGLDDGFPGFPGSNPCASQQNAYNAAHYAWLNNPTKANWNWMKRATQRYLRCLRRQKFTF